MIFDDETVKRFWSKVDVRGPDECWEWQACLSEGYGQLGVGGKMTLAHRISWQLANEREIPDGMVIRHSCDNRRCVNSSHLLLGTQADNVHDMHERARARPPRGDRHWNAGLTNAEVLEIHRLLAIGMTQASIAKKFGRPQPTISDIATGRSWAWLEDEE